MELVEVMAVRFDEELGLRLTENFWTNEFACKCPKLRRHPREGFCNGCVRIDSLFKLVLPLQRLRDIVGPLIVESGGRCWKYHEWIYKHELELKPTRNSAHLHHLAADVFPKNGSIGKNPEHKQMLIECGFKGVGWHLGSAGNKIHLDVMDRGEFTEWSYG